MRDLQTNDPIKRKEITLNVYQLPRDGTVDSDTYLLESTTDTTRLEFDLALEASRFRGEFEKEKDLGEGLRMRRAAWSIVKDGVKAHGMWIP